MCPAVVPSQGPHPRGRLLQFAPRAPAPWQVGFPSHLAPTYHGQSYDLKSKEKNQMMGPQKHPCQLPLSWARMRRGEGGSWWSPGTQQARTEGAVSCSVISRSVTLGKDVPSLDLTLPSVTRHPPQKASVGERGTGVIVIMRVEHSGGSADRNHSSGVQAAPASPKRQPAELSGGARMGQVRVPRRERPHCPRASPASRYPGT